MTLNKNFWKQKQITDFTTEEWEALCDHCGKCCLHKIEDEETGVIFLTYVACKYLEISTCLCTQYEKRLKVNPHCIALKPGSVDVYGWLPDTCAYRLIWQKKELPWWHPLVSGDILSVHHAEKSVAHIAIAEADSVSLENHIIFRP